MAQVPEARCLLLKEGRCLFVVIFQDVGGAIKQDAFDAACLLKFRGLIVGQESFACLLVGLHLEQDDAFPKGQLIEQFGIQLRLR